jgi:hypothetical protein
MSLIISLFTRRDLDMLKKKMIMLYILNVIDIIFTLLLVKTGMFKEANFIMAPFINNNQVVSLFIKVILPVFLLLVIASRLGKASDRQLYQSNILITICLVIYFLIDISHIVWSALYISYI